ncbi:MAG: diguanylate cyclase [Mariniblastus sp.]
MFSHAQPTHSEIKKLNSLDFPSLDSLRRAATTTTEPVLLVVQPDELTEALTWLEEKDDVCLDSSPPEMIEYRLECLNRERTGLRDSLTGLLNRQRFETMRDQLCEDSNANQPTSMIYLDLDGFKQINSKYGHAVGDQVLSHVANVLKQNCDHSAYIGRLGSEKFGVACNRNAPSAKMLAEKLRSLICDQPAVDEIIISASLGIATTHMKTPGRKLMEQAQQALFAAKNDGRNCCCSFDDLLASSQANGSSVEAIGLENQARVLAERVANVITMQSRKMMNSLRQEADVDGLTGCYNRRCLDRRLADEFKKRNDNELSIAFLDLDYFGLINKEHGWATGDKLLIDVCNTIREEIRDTDWVGRYGGEEFCIVLPGMPMDEASTVLERLRKKVESTEYVSVEGTPIAMTVSIGLAAAEQTDADCSNLMDRASKRALFAKQSGRNQLCTSVA